MANPSIKSEKDTALINTQSTRMRVKDKHDCAY